MNLAYRLAHPVIESGADAEATVLVTITAPLGKIARRPVNLAVALDRSGSMAGEPLAIAKTALKQFVDQLLPTDRLTIVAFDDTALPIIVGQTATDKAALRAAVEAIEPGGMTNLSAGWLAAADALSRYAEPETYSRIIVISDGIANAGVVEDEQVAAIASGLSRRGMPTTTIGIGSGYDDTLLSLIAAHSGGNVHHLDSVDGIATLLNDEFEELIALYAQNVMLHVAPDASVIDATVLNGYPVAYGKAGFDVACGDIVMGDERYVLMRFRCGAHSGKQALTALTLRYQQIAGEVAFRELVAFIDIDRKDVVESTPIDTIVSTHLTIVKAATARRAAAELADVGDISGASFLLANAIEDARLAGLTQDVAELTRAQQNLSNDPGMTSRWMKTRSSSRSRTTRRDLDHDENQP